MPGWAFLDKILGEEPMHQACEEFFEKLEEKELMAKLKERDMRPRRIFHVGDIVRYAKTFKNIPDGEGVILKVDNLHEVGGQRTRKPPIRQKCYCVFAPNELALRGEVRRIARKLFYEPDYEASRLLIIENNRLSYVRDCPRSWLQPITSMEIHTHRFSDLLEEEEDGPELGEDS